MRRPIIKTKLSIINELQDLNHKIEKAKDVDDQDRTNKYHCWIDSNNNQVNTVNEALNSLNNDKDIKLQGILLDPSENEAPIAITEVFLHKDLVLNNA